MYAAFGRSWGSTHQTDLSRCSLNWVYDWNQRKNRKVFKSLFCLHLLCRILIKNEGLLEIVLFPYQPLRMRFSDLVF